MTRPILYDTDPGVDDGMALFLALASPELEVTGVTTVYGNNTVEQTTRNALRLLAVAGRKDIPVAAGAGAPLRRPWRGARPTVHGADGLGGATLAGDVPGGETAQPLDEPNGAAGFIARMAAARPGELTLVAVGPLTNLALALQLEPRLPQLVKQVIVMGGAFFCPGNATPVAEANILNDPHAAEAVLAAGWPVTLAGLDVTMATLMTADYLNDLAALGTPAADFIGRMVPHYLNYYYTHYGAQAIATHDSSAIAYAIDPSLFETRRVPLHVETEGRCAGQTVPDPRGLWPGLPEADVCIKVDSERLLALYKERLAR